MVHSRHLPVRRCLATTQHRGVVRFGTFELDLQTGELWKSGVRVRVQQQPIEVLKALLQQPGEVVTREDLRQRIWPADVYVDFDRSLTKAVVKLRDALRDSAESPLYIETIPRVGYRFIASVDTTSRAPAGPEVRVLDLPPSAVAPVSKPKKAGRIIIAAALLLAMAAGAAWYGLRPKQGHEIHAIVVLPFSNLSGDANQEFFADGVTEAITTNLAKVASLTVISRTSALQYRNTNKPLPQIARELNVDGAVEGSVALAGGKVRVTAQLIDARNDRHLWAESYEQDVGEVLTVQSTVAMQIAEQIQAAISPTEHQRLASRRTVNLPAYEAYLRGRYLLTTQNNESLEKALTEFRRSIDLDPTYAPAYAGVADAYDLFANYGIISPKKAFPLAEAAAAKALQLDPNLAEAHVSLGFAKTHFEWDWKGAESEFQQGISLSPSYSTAYVRYAEYLSLVGRHDEALEKINRAHELDPFSMLINGNIGIRLYYARRYDEAEAQFQKTLELDPRRAWTRAFLAMTLTEKGQFDTALEEARTAAAQMAISEPMGVAHIYARMGRRAEALGIVQRLAKEDIRTDYQNDWCGIASIYFLIGDKQRAFQFLDRAYQERDFSLSFMKVNPWLDPMRSDPRFRAMLRRIDLQ